MAQTHDIGNVYWHTLVYPSKPKGLISKAETQEIEEPYRFGKGTCIRIPFTRLSLVLGLWVKEYSENQALTNAINGRGMKQSEVDWDTIRYGADYNDV